MFRLKHILTLLLAVSIIMAGFPVQAKPQCPMAAKMQIQQMDMKGMKDCCAKTAKQEQKKGGCCGDPACAEKCLSMSNASITFFGITQATSLSLASSTERFYGSDHVLVSHLLNNQDRPPKHLS